MFASWRIPLDGWFPYLSTGSPAFHEYQTFPHIVTGFFARFIGGDRAYSLSLYLLLALWPIAVYVGARLLGWRMRAALAAALVASLVANFRGYGLELGSYTFAGLGVWSQLWAMWLLPISLGLSWRAVDKGRNGVLAALVLSLTIVSHIITGYLALLAVAVWIIVRGRQGFGERLKRGIAVGAGALAASAWLLIPVLLDRRWVISALAPEGDFRRNSYGLGQVLGWLFTGKIFDAGFDGPRIPIITILVLVGVVLCIVRFRSDVRYRALLFLFLLSIVLYSGPKTFGFILNLLPASDTLIFHRYIIAVHMSGILLAGVAASFIFGLVVGVVRAVRPRMQPAMAAAVVLIIGLAVLAPAWVERARYASFGEQLIDRQRTAEILDGGARRYLIEVAKRVGDGRIHAGLPNNWGRSYVVGYIPGYSSLLDRDADAIGFTYRVPSVLTNMEAYLDERNPYQLNLFGVRYLLIPRGRAPAVTAEPLESRGNHVLWEVPNSGYMGLFDTTGPVRVSSARQYAVTFARFLTSPELRESQLPIIDYGGQSVGRPTASGSESPEGSRGTIQPEVTELDRGIFRAQVNAERTTAVVLKASYHPRWKVTVDGKKVSKFIAAPGFPAVTVEKGVHTVEFRYVPVSSYPFLFIFGVLALFAVGYVFGGRSRRAALSRLSTSVRPTAIQAVSAGASSGQSVGTSEPVVERQEEPPNTFPEEPPYRLPEDSP